MAIFNNTQPPIELLEYFYRKEFGLTEEEMQNEPADKFLVNLKIMEWLKEKEYREMKALEK